MKTLAEVQAPREYEWEMLEADLQKQCVKWARLRGYWARKFSSIAQRSVPDYLFAADVRGPRGFSKKFATEFKKPGTKPKWIEKHKVLVMSTEAQFEEQEAMRDAGWFVFECDDFEKFKSIVIGFETGVSEEKLVDFGEGAIPDPSIYRKFG